MVHLMKTLPALVSLLPLAFAAPALEKTTTDDTPELSALQWNIIQSSFDDGIRHLGAWSWNKAEDTVAELGGHGFTVNAESEGDETELTIWQRLKADPHSFSKLVKIIEFEGKAEKYLDDKDAQITFFAPNDNALKPPKHHKHRHDESDLMELLQSPSLAHLVAFMEKEPLLFTAYGKDDNNDDEDKRRKKEIFRKIAGAILAYHGLPKAYTTAQLAQNSTFETALKAEDGSFAGLHRRIRVQKELIPPTLKLNFYAKVVASDRKSRNGYFHAIDHPLLPPGSILDELFLFPDSFSTLTSSVQKIHGAHALDYGYDHKNSERGKPKFHGTPLATLFAPTNAAFHLLPPKLKFYLFSPWGEKALKKLLEYHYIPHTLLLSETIHVGESFTDQIWAAGDDPSFHKEFAIETALRNATIDVEIEKKKVLPIEGAVKTTIKVNGNYVEVIDVPARNGAVHVLDKLLVPPHHHHHEHDVEGASEGNSWNDWEEWLPKWADEE